MDYRDCSQFCNPAGGSGERHDGDRGSFCFGMNHARTGSIGERGVASNAHQEITDLFAETDIAHKLADLPGTPRGTDMT